MGSITQLSSGNWRVRIELPRNQNGERQWWSQTVPTKREAQNLEHEKEVELAENGTLAEGDEEQDQPRTLLEAIQKWVNYKRGNVAKSTIDTYVAWTERHIQPDLGDKPLESLTPGDLRDFLDRKHKQGKIIGDGGLSWESVKQLYKILSQALEHAVEDGVIDESPMRKKFLPPKSVEEKQGKKSYLKKFTLDKIRQLKTILAEDPYYGPLFSVALDTGMRKCELLGLRWESVDLDRKVLEVQRALVLTGGEWVEKTTLKTENSARQIELDQELVEEFRLQRERQEQWKQGFEGDWPDHNRVFTTSEGTPPDNLLRRMRRLLKDTGLPRVTFHDLRHLHCTMLIANGAPYNVVQDRVGHSTVKFMLERYTHSQEGQQRQALAQVRQAFNGEIDENGN